MRSVRMTRVVAINLPAGGNVSDGRLRHMRKRCSLANRLRGAGDVVDKGLWLLRKRCFVFSRPLVVVAAGDGMLKDGQHKHLAADAKA